MPKVLSQTKEQSVLAKLDGGLPHSQISLETAVSMGHISKLCNILCPNLACPSGGHPNLLSTTAAHHATRLATNAHSASTSKLAQELQAITGVSVSRETVHRTLKQEGLEAVTKSNKLLLKEEVCDEWLLFAKAHKDWTVEDWKRVLWSDESKINHLGSDGVQWAWKLPGEGLSRRLPKPTAHSGGGSLMVWGCMGWDGVGFLTKLDVNMTKELYVEVLKD
jgi:transposase